MTTMPASILVIDDEPSIRDAFELVFKGLFELCALESVEQALASSTEEVGAVRVIFLDGLLGRGCSGERGLPKLKAKFPGAFVVFTGALGDLQRVELRSAGAAMVLPKPWEVEELRSVARLGMAITSYSR